MLLCRWRLDGACQPPDPATVRPLEVLKEALDQLLNKWTKGGIGMDYVYACSQLKAIRQDLVVRGSLVCAVCVVCVSCVPCCGERDVRERCGGRASCYRDRVECELVTQRVFGG